MTARATAPATSGTARTALAPAADGAPAGGSSTASRRRSWQPRLVVGLAITAFVVLVAVVGPWLAPHGEHEITGDPYSTAGVLGTDYLGQDVLSRVLHGGLSVLVVALLSTVVGLVLGVLVGILAAYVGGWFDEVVMRLNDAVLAFPQILLTLLVLSTVAEPTMWLIVVLVGISHAPRVARVSRGVALGLTRRDFVTSAEALGESRLRIVVREVLPNMSGPLLAEAGLRLTYSIGMVAGIAFLGFSTDPGAADWGQMINENRLALLVQPWGVLAPVLMIGIFAVGTNLAADGIAQLTSKGGDR
ncbi:ABC transporter permease [Isoptericola cucumis]|uniref:Peptide ABC transporter permease n=1 Tax=Isoptericola cucumis TaxID=1776856 RepID=A0ABQ2B0Z8_9MICO|nr:ABC transporter permease [Isoptericola cucumis]GGI05193.1 peptide ABC transporter permease [Isoptericola cucumis]